MRNVASKVAFLLLAGQEKYYEKSLSSCGEDRRQWLRHLCPTSV
jgi:hypothetical protein